MITFTNAVYTVKCDKCGYTERINDDWDQPMARFHSPMVVNMWDGIDNILEEEKTFHIRVLQEARPNGRDYEVWCDTCVYQHGG